MVDINKKTDLCDQADVLEWKLPHEVLDVLLLDRTTGKNIIWGTKDYERQFGEGKGFGEQDEIKAEQLIIPYRPVIRPRTVKDKAEQRQRAIERAEVFTPAWVCNSQNNLVDAAWFGRKTSPFNIETFCKETGKHGWKTNRGAIHFPKGKTAHDYVLARRLEISCGEAPYLTSRYDADNGNIIPVADRIGLLDRKLRVVSQELSKWGPECWFSGAKLALQSVYGYDWQGDNVLLARENLLFAVIEEFKEEFAVKETFTSQSMLELAEIISWNIWQMDGIKFVVPNSCKNKGETTDMYDPCKVCHVNNNFCTGCKKHDIFSHNGTRCKVMDWKEGRVEIFLPERSHV